jgi:hypothetical protein
VRNIRKIAVAASAVAALAAAGPASAATSATSTPQDATTTVAATLTATFPTGAFAIDLSNGVSGASAAQAVNVKSNKGYGVRVFADNSPLKEWAAAAYGTAVLANPLKVSLNSGADQTVPQGTAATGVTTLAGTSLTDAEAQTAGDVGTNLSLVFKQAFSYKDKPADYRAQITYAADQTF